MSTTCSPPCWVPHCTSNGLYNDWQTHGSPLRANINCFSCKSVSLTILNSSFFFQTCKPVISFVNRPLHLQFQSRLQVCSPLFCARLDFHTNLAKCKLVPLLQHQMFQQCLWSPPSTICYIYWLIDSDQVFLDAGWYWNAASFFCLRFKFSCLNHGSSLKKFTFTK